MIRLLLLLLLPLSLGAAAPLSHPPLRRPVARTDRPAASGPAYYVNPATGSDDAPGTEAHPWKTIQASLPKLAPGDTLYLAGGVYYETVYCAIAGTEEKPITIRSRPGELAILDGGLPEFQKSPADAWEPVGDNGEYRSRRAYRNLRDVVGLFGDSNIGLQTYWHPEDLRSETETSSGDPHREEAGADVAYCGPGLWYDRATGHIHARLAHTHLSHPRVANYRGETDPRKLPLVIAPFNVMPLFIDLGAHLRFEDLVIRGGGLNTVMMHFGIDITFDHVTLFGGTYGLRSKNSGPVRFLHSAIYGGIPPWAFYGENALHDANPMTSDPYTHGAQATGKRNIARLTNHALMVLEGYEESDVFAYPFNNRWEIAWSEFADGHDGIYPNGHDIRVHHNWIGDLQDDAVYLSSPARGVCDNIHVYRNLITGCTTAFGFHGRGGPEGNIYIYGNLVDARDNASGRWRTANLAEIKPYGTNFFLVHGSSRMQAIESIHFYYNTAILHGDRRSFLGGTFSEVRPGSTRQVANNLFVYLGGYPRVVGFNPKTAFPEQVKIDHNFHWSPAGPPPEAWAGIETVADPGFAALAADPEATNDYRPRTPLPARPLEAPLEPGVAGPDAGAFPREAKPWQAGVDGRRTPGAPIPTTVIP